MNKISNENYESLEKLHTEINDLVCEANSKIEDYNAQIQLLISDPARALGRVNDATSVSALRSRFLSLGLSTTTTAQRARREFDGRSNLLGVDEGGFQF